MKNRKIDYARSLIFAAVIASFIAATAFSAPLSVTVISPGSTVYLDSNQSIINFTATASGGTPFPGQNTIYTYQWYIQKGSSCPGINPTYQYQIPTLRYSPTGATANCMIVAQATDYLGATVTATTGTVVVNPAFSSNGVLTRTSYNVTQGQNVTISMAPPIGGTLPYHYQWLASFSLNGEMVASTANSICAVNPNTLNCVFTTNSQTQTGLYDFQLSSWDSATIPTKLLSKSIVVMVKASVQGSNSVGSTTSTINATTTVATTTMPEQSKTTIPTTTQPTTSAATTTVPYAPPKGGSTNIFSSGWNALVKWIDKLLG